MSKNVTMTIEQYNALVAASAKPAKAAPKRALSFKSYASGEESSADAKSFKAALVTGVNAERLYAHASVSKRAVSAAAIREVLSALGIALT